MPVEDLNGGHHHTVLCQRGWERKWQHAAAMRSQEALRRSFTAYGEELVRVEVFKYLGRLIACDDADTQAMQSNLRKAQGCWSRILGSWSYPRSKEVLEAASLQTIAHYMDVHWQTVTNFIVNRPIWELCAGAVRRRGSQIRPFWWDQPMDLDLAKERGLLFPAQGPAGTSSVKN